MAWRREAWRREAWCVPRCADLPTHRPTTMSNVNGTCFSLGRATASRMYNLATLSHLPRFLSLGRIQDCRGNRVGLEVQE